ncbi:hypothetical protein F4780DRAFT_433505 [Xylariomycetidae sp. FL0641]|nr:hypothetical protein F4780DRAFT_433505 [Xylariomycetidae sp. FL0641]
MASNRETSLFPKRKLMTYGKAAKKRQPKTAFTPVTASESMSDDDPISASKTTATRRRPSLITSPREDATPTRPKPHAKNDDPQATPRASHAIFSSERKRKLSQIYAVQDSTETDEDRSPAAPAPRRSRLTAPDNRPPTKRRIRESAPVQSAASDANEAGVTEARLSSPPLTPKPPKAATQKANVKVGRRPASGIGNPKGTRPDKQQALQIPLHLARDTVQGSKPSGHEPDHNDKKQPAALPAQTKAAASPKKPRKRLIDALKQQTEDDEDEDDLDFIASPVKSSQAPSNQILSSQTSDFPMPDSQVPPTTPTAKTRTAPGTATRTFARSSSALKFTYGQGRKVLEEEDDGLFDALALPEDSSASLKGRRLELRAPVKPIPALGALEEDDLLTTGSPNSKLRDIHELRQAGANSRVADAMQDLIDQMGTPTAKPSSSRRAALLQVAEKIQDKTFMRQCRDHGVETALLKSICKETDAISGFLIMSIVVTILARGSPSHAVQLLRQAESAPIFARLLGVDGEIKRLSKDRKNNLSRRSQASIDTIQESLRNLAVWDGAAPPQLSPRGVTIKCLQLLISRDANIGRDPTIFSPAVTECLFQVLSKAVDDTEYWSYPATAQSVDFRGALSVLDTHAVCVAETERSSGAWASSYLPVVAEVFKKSLERLDQGGKGLADPIDKLTINITNNNLEAPDIFASKQLLPTLAGSISKQFGQVLISITEESWTESILNSLVLRLGILINFSEHSSLVRQVVNDCQDGGRNPVDDFIQLFLENHRRTSEADSMEKSHLNVAFGYLAVLLGYLALHAPIRQKLKSSHSARSIGPLIDSLREFIAHYKKVESTVVEEEEEEEESDRPHSGYTERLQDLVQQLEDRAAYD